MGPGEQPFVGLDVEEQDQIVNVGSYGVVLTRIGPNERFGVGVVNGGEGVEEKPGVVVGDLEGLGDCGRVDSLVGGRVEKLALQGE